MNFVILITSLCTTLFNLFKSTGSVFNLPTTKSSTFGFELFKLVGTLTILLMSSFSTPAFEAIKSFLAATSDVSMSVASF